MRVSLHPLDAVLSQARGVLLDRLPGEDSGSLGFSEWKFDQ